MLNQDDTAAIEWEQGPKYPDIEKRSCHHTVAFDASASYTHLPGNYPSLLLRLSPLFFLSMHQGYTPTQRQYTYRSGEATHSPSLTCTRYGPMAYFFGLGFGLAAFLSPEAADFLSPAAAGFLSPEAADFLAGEAGVLPPPAPALALSKLNCCSGLPPLAPAGGEATLGLALGDPLTSLTSLSAASLVSDRPELGREPLLALLALLATLLRPSLEAAEGGLLAPLEAGAEAADEARDGALLPGEVGGEATLGDAAFAAGLSPATDGFLAGAADLADGALGAAGFFLSPAALSLSPAALSLSFSSAFLTAAAPLGLMAALLVSSRGGPVSTGSVGKSLAAALGGEGPFLSALAAGGEATLGLAGLAGRLMAASLVFSSAEVTMAGGGTATLGRLAATPEEAGALAGAAADGLAEGAGVRAAWLVFSSRPAFLGTGAGATLFLAGGALEGGLPDFAAGLAGSALGSIAARLVFSGMPVSLPGTADGPGFLTAAAVGGALLLAPGAGGALLGRGGATLGRLPVSS